MDSKRLLIGSVVGGVMLSIMGLLIYELVLGSFFETRMMVAERASPVIWAAVVSALAHGLLLTLVIGWAGDSSIMGGLKTAALVGFLIWLGADMILFGLMEYTTLGGALMDSVGAIVQYGLAGAAIGAVSGGKAQTAGA